MNKLLLVSIFLLGCGQDQTQSDRSDRPGPPGAPGVAGTNGADGKNGIDGKDSTVAGPQGISGVAGKDGLNGSDGKDGLNGSAGKDGLNGSDGKDGLNGSDGKDGLNGSDGKDGASGKDGLSAVSEIIPLCGSTAAHAEVAFRVDGKWLVYFENPDGSGRRLTTLVAGQPYRSTDGIQTCNFTTADLDAKVAKP